VEKLMERLKKEAEMLKERLKNTAEYYIKEFEREAADTLKGVEEAAKRLEPAYVFHILEKGGHAVAFDFTNESKRDEELRIHVGHFPVETPTILVPPGKHKMLLVIIPE